MGKQVYNFDVSVSDSVFMFMEMEEYCQENSNGGHDDEEEDHAGVSCVEEKKAFWEAQNELLQEAVSKISPTEIRIKKKTEEIWRNMQSKNIYCSCSGMAKDCHCALNYIAQQLREARYNAALCKSKWRWSPDIPSGEHSYVDVVIEPKKGKKTPTRIVIELNFRAEFVMARSSKEYNSLVDILPEIFVGKSEKLQSVIRIMCASAKKCMKENNMHLGPWRKHKYMQSKWFGTTERIGLALTILAEVSDRRSPTKAKASLLTFDLHCNVVEVV